MAVKAKVVFIPGTAIPSRTRTLGAGVFNAGNKARLEPTMAAVRSAAVAMNYGVAEVHVATGVAIDILIQASMGGLLAGAAHIEYSMDTVPPLIPVDTNALRQAFKIIPQPSKIGKMSVEVGWPDAKIVKKGEDGVEREVDMYAAYVHEMTSPPYGDVKWTRPGSGPKFFEAAIKRSNRQLTAIMAKHLKTILP